MHFVLKYNKATRRIEDLVQFPKDNGDAAVWTAHQMRKGADEETAVEVLNAESVDVLRRATHYFSKHDFDGTPVPLRDPKPEEFRVNGEEEQTP